MSKSERTMSTPVFKLKNTVKYIQTRVRTYQNIKFHSQIDCGMTMIAYSALNKRVTVSQTKCQQKLVNKQLLTGGLRERTTQ